MNRPEVEVVKVFQNTCLIPFHVQSAMAQTACNAHVGGSYTNYFKEKTNTYIKVLTIILVHAKELDP